MDFDEQEGLPIEYSIPQNYEDAGGLLGGRFTQRNGIEMAIVGAPLAWINMNLIFPNVPVQTGIIIFILSVLPPVFLCAIGIGGESVSQFLFAFFRFLRKRRFLSFIAFFDGKKGSQAFDLQSVLNTFKSSLYEEEEDEEEDEEEEEMPPIEKTPKEKKPEGHMHIMNSAMKEMLLRKFELTDEDDDI